jgi:hypothetical protein
MIFMGPLVTHSHMMLIPRHGYLLWSLWGTPMSWASFLIYINKALKGHIRILWHKHVKKGSCAKIYVSKGWNVNMKAKTTCCNQ